MDPSDLTGSRLLLLLQCIAEPPMRLLNEVGAGIEPIRPQRVVLRCAARCEVCWKGGPGHCHLNFFSRACRWACVWGKLILLAQQQHNVDSAATNDAVQLFWLLLRLRGTSHRNICVFALSSLFGFNMWRPGQPAWLHPAKRVSVRLDPWSLPTYLLMV